MTPNTHNPNSTPNNNESEMVQAEHLSLTQLEGMLKDMIRWETAIIKGDLNLDINIVKDDIISMKIRIDDKKRIDAISNTITIIHTPETINRLRELRRIGKKINYLVILPQNYTTSDIDIVAAEISDIITYENGK